MSIPAKFMEVARGRLDRAIYDEIYQRAVGLEHKRQIRPTTADPVDKPALASRIEAHLNGETRPPEASHIQGRIERRLEIDVTLADLGELLRVAQAGGPNVQVVKQVMDLVQECVVNWRGKHFVVVYNKSRGKLITAFAKQRKSNKKLRAGRPKDWRSDTVDYTTD